MNSFGRIFRINIFGESHGKVIGVTIDGCPPGIELNEEDFYTDLERRKPSSKGTTPRQEADNPDILSGIYNGKTSGAPITIIFENNNIKSIDYDAFANSPRPGHADLTAKLKYKGYNDARGGGMFSGRMTIAMVAAGIIAKKIIFPLNVEAKLIEAGGSKNINDAVREAIESNDSIGGIIKCIATKVPSGIGEPFFDSVESLLSHLLFSIPGVKGIEFGDFEISGNFQSAKIQGSDYNDYLIDKSGKTETNHSGGVNGGITNGNNLVFTVALRPPSSLKKDIETIELKSGNITKLKIKGRHDVCFALRASVIIEAVTAIVLADLYLINKIYK